jgi:dTDP-4-amino-4,6-dideoxygalactose transaminase
MIRLPGFNEEGRNRFIRRLAEEGISANVHFKPLPLLTAYKSMGFDISYYPNAYSIYQNEITLPLHTGLSDDDVDYICACVKRLWQQGA